MSSNKYFLISIDVEGDNLWQWDGISPITTHNGAYVERFQKLCEKYGFVPTYLLNYEMTLDDILLKTLNLRVSQGKCEIGMHMHAWNCPPIYDLKRRIGDYGKPFLTEYPDDIMEEKIAYLTELIKMRYNVQPLVHRAGRWGIDNRYLKLLDKYGYMVDTSVVPGMDLSVVKGWTEGSHGVDYRLYSTIPYPISEKGLWEVPVTTFKTHYRKRHIGSTIIEKLYYLKKAALNPRVIYLRPKADNIDDMCYMIKKGLKSKNNYIMFMMHSSEMMPGGSPTFCTQESIDRMYYDLEKVFSFASKYYTGVSVGNYRLNHLNSISV